ncbi:MAG TPA: hypothetical protein VM204_08090 [Gaiellaceae bacterium]|nr:hypothetical protein [Gaiellaceae bacterium]
MHAFTYDTERRRHEERIAASLRRLAAGSGRVRRLRPDPCPLVALAQWLAARRRPTAAVAS